MSTTAKLESEIAEIEAELRHTPYNKATQYHIGKLKAKLAKLKAELEIRRYKQKAGRGGGEGYAIRKSGYATVAIVGYPSTGKSTLLNKLTSASSEVADYPFTTLNIVPGMMDYNGAKIQLLDMPGLIGGASAGKGRGRLVLSAIRSVDLLLLLVDVYNYQPDKLINELMNAGIRLNETKPAIKIKKLASGGIDLKVVPKKFELDLGLIKTILREYNIVNAEVVIKTNITETQLIDFLAGNCVYLPAIGAINKIDLVSEPEIDKLLTELRSNKSCNTWIPIAAEYSRGLDQLKVAIYRKLNFINVYLKPQGGKPDFTEPLVVPAGATIETICNRLHRDFIHHFRYALVWGKSAKYPRQTVGLTHTLEHGDIVTIVIKRR